MKTNPVSNHQLQDEIPHSRRTQIAIKSRPSRPNAISVRVKEPTVRTLQNFRRTNPSGQSAVEVPVDV